MTEKDHRPIEIEPGHPQIKWNTECQQWLLVGDVLRCHVDWDREKEGDNGLGALAIRIDDQLLSGEEFCRMLETYEGWGMRIEFMPPDEVENPPKPVLRKTGR